MEQDTNEATCVVCIICMKNPATDTPIRWSGRKGFICEACLEKSWECPDCSRLFYTGENKGYKPRHNVAIGKRQQECHGWKSEYRQKFERRMGWISSVKIDKN